MEDIKFEKLLNDLIEERLQDSYKELLTNSKSKEIIMNYYNLFEQLEKTMPNINLLETYQEAEIEACTIQSIKAYKRGFKDCLLILNSL